MNRDLFLAILSMDSYNRGYGPSLIVFGPNNAGQSIGNAIVKDIPLQADPEAVGFYGLAYDVSVVAGFTDGETVIAYRGSEVGRSDVRLLLRECVGTASRVYRRPLPHSDFPPRLMCRKLDARMSQTGSLSEWREFSSSHGKPPYRFRDRGSARAWPVMGG